jgi:hypothetical protein
MKKIGLLLLLFCVLFACNNKDGIIKTTTVTLNFTHHWNGVPITSSDFNTIKFTNANGEKISIERLRYVLSNIQLGTNYTNYNLVNLTENNGLQLILEDVPTGNNTLNFTFGFNDTDNIDGIYQDLNSASFNVPGMLGGGYHFMQLDGKYIDTNSTEAGFNYHAIRAVDITDPENLVFQDTSFLVDLGTVLFTNNATIEIKMNLAEWFKNPNTWNLNELNTVLMPNFEAQKMMNENGKSVFSLGEVN